MTDPKRWLEEGGDATFEERELLEAGRAVKAPSPLRKRVWLGVATGASGLGVAADAAGAVLQKGAIAKSALSSVSASAVKGVLTVALLGGAGWAVTTLRASPDVPPPAVGARSTPPQVPRSVGQVGARTDSVTGEPAPTASVQETSPYPAGETRSSARPGTASRTPDGIAETRAPESRATSRLREESAAVLAIRRTLLSGDAKEALRMLERARVEFPNGALAQDREALTVRALVESGQKEAARRRGEAFLRTFPKSPHAAEVRALLGP
jgi:hypothetical protein